MAALQNFGEGESLRLYFQIAEDHTADAAVVARASLAFVAGVKELAYILDPSLTVSVGIEGHQEGSLWEDLKLIWGKASAEVESHPNKYLLALSAITWLLAPPANRVRDDWWQPTLERYFPTKAERDAAERALRIAQNGKVAVREKEQFYREIGRDTGIEGVGANIERKRPDLIVPKASFPEYSGQSASLDSDLDRTTTGPMRVIILSPVLEVSSRRWKFATAQGEFGAAVRDRAFLERIVAGQTSVKMRGGVQLDVELETKERLIDGVWSITERNVLHVIDIIEPTASRQDSMFPDDSSDQ